MMFVCPTCKAEVTKFAGDPLGCPCCGYMAVKDNSASPTEPTRETKKVDDSEIRKWAEELQKKHPLFPEVPYVPVYPQYPAPTPWTPEGPWYPWPYETKPFWEIPCRFCGLPRSQCHGIHVWMSTTTTTSDTIEMTPQVSESTDKIIIQ